MVNLKYILKDYGVDYEGVMERFMNNETLYLKILFMISNDENIWKLEQALKENNYMEAFDAAHTLKGVAANLGLVLFEKAIGNIVEPLRVKEQRNDYINLYHAIKEEYSRVIDLVRFLKEVR